MPSEAKTKSHLQARAATGELHNINERPTHGLTALQVERRFGIGRVVIARLCQRNPGLGMREPSRVGKEQWHWIIDPPRLGQLLDDALDPAELATRFDVPVERFATLDPPRRAMLAAVLPLAADRQGKWIKRDKPWEAEGIHRATWYRRRKSRPSPLPERAEVGHARD
jgi:hypothetical protein